MQVDRRYLVDYRKLANDYSSIDEDFYQSSFFENRFNCFVFYQGKSKTGNVILILSPVDHPEFEIAAELPVIEQLFQKGILWSELESAYLAKSD